MIAYEAARTRARALRALGHEAEASRQASYALAVATTEGWPHRMRWIRAEFGLSDRGTVHTLGRRPSPTTDTEVQGRQLRALAAVSKAAARVVDPDAVIRIALDETIRILNADRAFVFLTADEQQLVPRLGRDAAGNDIERLTGYATTLVERVAATGEPVVVTGTEQGAALGAHSAVIHGLRSILVAPLRIEDRILGVVYLDSRVAKGIFITEDADILTAVTDHIATSLETARATQLEVTVQTARKQLDLAEMLHDAVTRMSARNDPDGVLECLLEQAARIRGDQDVALLTNAEDGVVARVLARDGTPLHTLALPSDEPVTRLLTLGQATAASGAHLPAPVAALLGPVASWLAVPLVTQEARLGALLLTSPTADAYGETEANVATTLVAQGAAAYDKAFLFAQVQALAVIDQLTGIPNRRHFFDVAERDLAAASRHDRPAAIMMIDIDHFKRINDAYGHLVGDDVIRVVASRLAAGIRVTDLVGRYGGEEFAVLLPDTGIDAGEKLADRLRATVSGDPVETRAGPVNVTVSVGVTARMPGDPDLTTLINRADQALYLAKRNGRDRVQVA